MRVLVFSAKYAPVVGGLERFLAQLLPAMCSAGHEVHVVTSSFDTTSAEEEIDGVLVHRVPLEGALVDRDLQATLQTKRVVRDLRLALRPDIVHVHDLGAASWAQLRTRAGDPAPVVVTLHTTWDEVTGGPGGMSRATLQDADRVTAVSEAVRRAIVRLDPSLAGSVDIIRYSVPQPDVAPSDAPVDPPRLLMAGRLAPQKGFDVGLRAFRRILSAHPGARLTILGEGPDRGALQELTTELEIDRSVVWRGAIATADVVTEMLDATIVMMPSRFEGYPLVALESAGLGRVVVGSDIPGLDEVVLKGTTGVLVPRDDPVALADAVLALLADMPQLLALGRAARARATTESSFAACVESYLDVYRALVGGES